MSNGKYPFEQKSKKSPGRRERRMIQKLSLTKGYGNEDQYFWKRVAERRRKKKINASKIRKR